MGNYLGAVYPIGEHPAALPPTHRIPTAPGHRTRPGMLQERTGPSRSDNFGNSQKPAVSPGCCHPPSLPQHCSKENQQVFGGWVPPQPQPRRVCAAPALRAPGAEHPPLTPAACLPTHPPGPPCLSLSVLELCGCPWSSLAVPGAPGLSLVSPAAALPAHLPAPGDGRGRSAQAALPGRGRGRPEAAAGRGKGKRQSRGVPGGSGRSPGGAWGLLGAAGAVAGRERRGRCGSAGAAGRAARVGKTRSCVKIHPKTAICAH